MERGLAYHFVIGNGTESGDGQIEIGPRWPKQDQGGHVTSLDQNKVAIGICLVGDFNQHRPTKAQVESMLELIRYLRAICGNPPVIVHTHRSINIKPTDCPGRLFPYNALREFK
jgi:N-acetyl-anhydromuramyl-L-alanine amidase AmpD